MAEENNGLEIQQWRAGLLAIQQTKHQVAQFFDDLIDEGRSYQKPSKFKYGILFTLAAIVDGLDFLELSGLGWFVAKVISIFATVLIFLIFVFTGTKQKGAKEYRKKLQDFLENTGKNVAHAARMVMRIEKVAEYAPFLSGVTEFIMSAAANLVPVIDLFPWMIIGVWLSYMDEKKTLQNAAEAAEAAAEVGEETINDIENEEEQLEP